MLKNWIYFTSIVFIFLSCRKDIGLVNIGNYPNDIGKLITANCATSGCHNDKSYKAAANLNLTTWNDLFTGSNGGSAVIPFSSKFSFLCNFINTYPDLGLTSQPTMPINKPPLSKDEVKKIMDWVDGSGDKYSISLKECLQILQDKHCL